MTHFTGLMIESVVAILLMFTIAYCIMLNSRLKRLKADESSLKATIAELITATEIAERAIGGLKHTARDCNENLGGKIAAANDFSIKLAQQVQHGEDILRRVSKIAMAARINQAREAEPAAPQQSSPKAIVAAAQAFSERRRAGSVAA